MSRWASGSRRKARHTIRALDRSGWACVYCGRPLMLAAVLGPDLGWWKQRQHQSGDGLLVATVDHVVPVAAGGPKTAASNIVAACGPCNHARADNPRLVEATPSGTAKRISWNGREFVREGRSWVEIR